MYIPTVVLTFPMTLMRRTVKKADAFDTRELFRLLVLVLERPGGWGYGEAPFRSTTPYPFIYHYGAPLSF